MDDLPAVIRANYGNHDIPTEQTQAAQIQVSTYTAVDWTEFLKIVVIYVDSERKRLMELADSLIGQGADLTVLFGSELASWLYNWLVGMAPAHHTPSDPP